MGKKPLLVGSLCVAFATTGAVGVQQTGATSVAKLVESFLEENRGYVGLAAACALDRVISPKIKGDIANYVKNAFSDAIGIVLKDYKLAFFVGTFIGRCFKAGLKSKFKHEVWKKARDTKEIKRLAEGNEDGDTEVDDDDIESKIRDEVRKKRKKS